MRFLTVILLVLFLSSCQNKVSSLQYTSKKVSEAVSTCTEAAKNVGAQLKTVSDISTVIFEGDEHYNAINNWDIHMMLR